MRTALARLLTLAVLCAGAFVGGALGTQPERAAQATLAGMPHAAQGGVDYAAARGVTQYVYVIDRVSGQVVAATGNAWQSVASESVMKLFIAAYYLRVNGGTLSGQLASDMWLMVTASDDAIASRYWRSAIVPTIASVYGLSSGTHNNPPRPGYWGATHITAGDVATFLLRAGNDPLVGGWLFQAMASATNYGTDGYNQNFGFNDLPGAGSKQGWGCDSYWVGPCAIHSVGFTAHTVAAVLQTGPSSTYGIMPSTATYTAQRIAAVPRQIPLPAPQHSGGLVLDVTGDGHGDVLGRDHRGAMYLYHSAGRHGIGHRIHVGSGWEGFDLLTSPGDVTGDGIPDLYARERATGYLWLYPLNRQGVPTAKIYSGGGWGIVNKLIPGGDQTGDGVPDLYGRSRDGILYLYRAVPGGGFDLRSVAGHGWGILGAVVGAADLSGDGRPDILGRDGSGVLWAYHTSSGGAVVSRRAINHGWGMFDIIASGYVDGSVTYLYGRNPSVDSGRLVVYEVSRTGWVTGPVASKGGGWNMHAALA